MQEFSRRSFINLLTGGTAASAFAVGTYNLTLKDDEYPDFDPVKNFEEVMEGERRAVFRTLAAQGIIEKNKSYLLTIFEIAADYHERNPNATSKELTDVIENSIKQYEGLKKLSKGKFTSTDEIEAMDKIASSFGVPGATAPLVIARENTLYQMNKPERQRKRLDDFTTFNYSFGRSRYSPVLRFDKVQWRAETQDAYGNAIDPIIKRELGLDRKDVRQMYAKEPMLAGFQSLMKELRSGLSQMNSRLNEQDIEIHITKNALVHVAEVVATELKAAKARLSRIEKQINIEEEEAQARLNTEIAYMSMNVTAQFIGMVGGHKMKDTVNHIQAGATSYLMVANALNKYGQKGLTPSPAMLSMNYLQAGMLLMSALQNAPTAEEVIMDQIAQMHKDLLEQMVEIRKEMYAYYNALDTKLDAQFNVSLDCFNAIFSALDDISFKLYDIARGVNNIDLKIDEIRADLKDSYNKLAQAAKDGFTIAYRDLLEDALHHSENSTHNLTASDADHIFKSLMLWATQFSKDSYIQPAGSEKLGGHTARSIIERLDGNMMFSSLDFLANEAVVHGNNDMLNGAGKIADIETVATSAGAFVEFYEANERFQGIPRKRPVNLMLIELKRSLNALRNIKTKTTEEGTALREDFFEKLAEKYKIAIQAFLMELEKEKLRIGEEYLARYNFRTDTYSGQVNIKGLSQTTEEAKKNGSYAPQELLPLSIKNIVNELVLDEAKRLLSIQDALNISPDKRNKLNIEFQVNFVDKKTSSTPYVFYYPAYEFHNSSLKARYLCFDRNVTTASLRVTLRGTLDGYGNVLNHTYTVKNPFILEESLSGATLTDKGVIEAKKRDYKTLDKLNVPFRFEFLDGSEKISDLRTNFHLTMLREKFPKANIYVGGLQYSVDPKTGKTLNNLDILQFDKLGKGETHSGAYDTAKHEIETSAASSWKSGNFDEVRAKLQETINGQRDYVTKVYESEIRNLLLSYEAKTKFQPSLLTPTSVTSISNYMTEAIAAKRLLEAYLRLGCEDNFRKDPTFEKFLSGENALKEAVSILSLANSETANWDSIFNPESGEILQVFEDYKKALIAFLNACPEMESYDDIEDTIKQLGHIRKELT